MVTFCLVPFCSLFLCVQRRIAHKKDLSARNFTLGNGLIPSSQPETQKSHERRRPGQTFFIQVRPRRQQQEQFEELDLEENSGSIPKDISNDVGRNHCMNWDGKNENMLSPMDLIALTVVLLALVKSSLHN